MTHAAARKLFEHHQEWALSVAGVALRRIGPQADGEEIRQVAQITTWKKALAFDPRRWTVKPDGNPFEIYAYPAVYGSCLMAGYRGASGRAKTVKGEWITFVSPEPTNRVSHFVEGGDGNVTQRDSVRLNEQLSTGPNQYAVEGAIDRSARLRLIASILDELPPRERYLVTEHYLGGASLTAVAESMHRSPATASAIHASALNLLRIAVARRGMKAGEWL